MPNARELLEQADALMRRSRQSHDDDVPVLTDVVDTMLPEPGLLDEPFTLAPLDLPPIVPERPPADALVAGMAPASAPIAEPVAAAQAVDPQVQELAEQ